MHQRTADIAEGEEQARLLPLDGVFNFRDYGGYAVPGGGRLRRGVLWRSGQHHGATDADLARIAGLNLASVHDLRSDGERRSHPCRRPEGFDGTIHIAADNWGDTRAAPHVGAAEEARVKQGRERTLNDAEATRQSMRRAYTTLPFRPALIAAMRVFMADLAEADGPVLVNCMAGKDRTGIAVAMAQRALGVHLDDVMADYLLTNSLGDQAERIAAGGRSVSSIVGELTPEALKVLMGVEADYLLIAFAAIAEKYGSEEAYLEQALGVDAALRERLRERLVEV